MEVVKMEEESGPVQYLLPKEVRDALLQYLVTRPYGEVAGGVKALSELEQAVRPGAPQGRAKG